MKEVKFAATGSKVTAYALIEYPIGDADRALVEEIQKMLRWRRLAQERCLQRTRSRSRAFEKKLIFEDVRDGSNSTIQLWVVLFLVDLIQPL